MAEIKNHTLNLSYGAAARGAALTCAARKSASTGSSASDLLVQRDTVTGRFLNHG